MLKRAHCCKQSKHALIAQTHCAPHRQTLLRAECAHKALAQASLCNSHLAAAHSSARALAVHFVCGALPADAVCASARPPARVRGQPGRLEQSRSSSSSLGRLVFRAFACTSISLRHSKRVSERAKPMDSYRALSCESVSTWPSFCCCFGLPGALALRQPLYRSLGRTQSKAISGPQ